MVLQLFDHFMRSTFKTEIEGRTSFGKFIRSVMMVLLLDDKNCNNSNNNQTSEVCMLQQCSVARKSLLMCGPQIKTHIHILELRHIFFKGVMSWWKEEENISPLAYAYIEYFISLKCAQLFQDLEPLC